MVRTLGGGEVDDVAVALEHVDLLNGLDGLDIELLERLLELLVVAGGPRGRALDLSPGSALATVGHNVSSESRASHAGGVDAVSAKSSLGADIPWRRGGLVGDPKAGNGRREREGQQQHTDAGRSAQLLQPFLNVGHVVRCGDWFVVVWWGEDEMAGSTR